MAEIKISNLNFKQINAVKILEKELKRDPFLLINFNELVNDLISERDAYKKQRDELINDMQNVKRKAEAWDKLKEEKSKEYVLRHNQLKQTSILDPRELSIKDMVWELKYDLQRMDELDGTLEFKNLLSDLEEQ